MIEYRTYKLKELRVATDAETPRIEGYAAVFDSLSEDLGGFREKVLPGCFANAIRSGDIRALFNHDPNYVLGRNTAGTLKLVEDEHGLKIVNDPPDTQWANDLMVSMKRGDIDQMSFAFRTVSDNWRKENDQIIRELIEVELYDVSPVTYPAYPQTVVHARDILTANQASIQLLSQVDGAGSEQGGDGDDGTQQRPDYDLLRRRLDLLKHF